MGGGGGGGGSSGGVLGVVTLSGHVQSRPLPPPPTKQKTSPVSDYQFITVQCDIDPLLFVGLVL